MDKFRLEFEANLGICGDRLVAMSERVVEPPFQHSLPLDLND